MMVSDEESAIRLVRQAFDVSVDFQRSLEQIRALGSLSSEEQRRLTDSMIRIALPYRAAEAALKELDTGA